MFGQRYGNAHPLRILHPSTNQTVEPTAALVGLAPPGATVQLRVDRQQPRQVVADETGRWTFAPDDRLHNGQHSVHAVLEGHAQDAASAYVTYTVRERI